MSLSIRIEQYARTNPFGKLLRLVFNLASLLLLCVLIFNLLETQSFRTVDHVLHAVEIGDGQFIHGSKLSCDTSGRGQRCSIDLSGKMLLVTTSPVGPAPNTIGECSASFDGSFVPCEHSYPTNSYWAHGVQLDSALLESAFAAESQLRFDWRTLLLGTSEGVAIAMVGIGAIVLPLLAVFGIPAVFARIIPPISWTGSANRKFANALVIALIVPTWFVLMITALALEFVD